jgi:hypothetical protein
VAQAPGYQRAATEDATVNVDWRIKNNMRLAPARAKAPEAPAAGKVAAR